MLIWGNNHKKHALQLIWPFVQTGRIFSNNSMFLSSVFWDKKTEDHILALVWENWNTAPKHFINYNDCSCLKKFTVLACVMNETGRETGIRRETDKHPERMEIWLLGEKIVPGRLRKSKRIAQNAVWGERTQIVIARFCLVLFL